MVSDLTDLAGKWSKFAVQKKKYFFGLCHSLLMENVTISSSTLLSIVGDLTGGGSLAVAVAVAVAVGISDI